MIDPNLKYDAVNMFRGFLALGIVWHHLTPPELIFGVPVNIPGRVIVWLFFVLSGHVLSLGFFNGRYSFEWKSIIQFYFRRILRLLPLLYSVCFLLWFFYFRDFSMSMGDAARYLLFLKYSFHDFPIIEFAWFLGPLVQLYILSPLLFYILLKFKIKERPWNMLFAIIGISVALQYIDFALDQWVGINAESGFVAAFDSRTMLGSLGPFLFGTLVGPLMDSGRKIFERRELIVRNNRLAILMIIGVSCMYYIAGSYFWVLPTATLVGICGLFIIVWCELQTKERLNQSGKELGILSKFLLASGTLSYGIFLWHGVWIAQTILKFPGYRDNYGYLTLAYVGVMTATILISLLTYYAVEMPFARLRKYV